MRRLPTERVPASSPILGQTAPVTPLPSASPHCSPLRRRENALANGAVRQIAPLPQNVHILGAATGTAQMTARVAPPLTAEGQVPAATMACGQGPITARGQAPASARGYHLGQSAQQQHRETSPQRQVTQQWSAVMPSATEVHGSRGYFGLAQTDYRPWSQCTGGPIPQIAAGRSPSPHSRGMPSPYTMEIQSTTEFPTRRQGLDSVPTLKKSPSAVRAARTRDILTESLTDSTCSPVSPQTPASSEDELVKEILAQAEAARQRATCALETCQESESLFRERWQGSSRSPKRQPQSTNTSPIVISPLVEDLVAAVDLSASSISTSQKVDTPPIQRTAPAFQETLAPVEPQPHGFENFENLSGIDSIANLKQGCSTPPWPERLASGLATAQIVRPHSYVLRDIEIELESLNADLMTAQQRAAPENTNNSSGRNLISSSSPVSDLPQLPASKESFESWRASLLGSASKGSCN